MTQKRPTQADVARLAGVSRATVSYVVNGVDTGRVTLTAETRQRVLAAIQQLGYQPDARAQALRSGGIAKTIGLLLPDLHNPYYWKVAAGVEREAQQAGFDLALYSTALNAEREAHTLQALLQRRIDGLILHLTFPQSARTLLEAFTQRGNPVVILHELLPDFQAALAKLDTVVLKPSYRESAHQLMHHLFSLGHRRIGFLYGVATPAIDSGRLLAYQEALQAMGIAVEDRLIARCGITLADGYQATQRLLQQQPRPTAIVAINDLLAIGALRAIVECGLRVPTDVSLTGFDDIEMAAYLNPPLTTVQYDAIAVGRAAVKLILQRLDEPMRPVQVCYLPTRLLIRQSTGPAPLGSLPDL
ncbi:MAG: LacI family DNA-binding transcriptional regulator [Caldilineaceae bacterium]|nr:LacI family DNA-binding transcriptional regulator [Caldilineaceae bacterium]